MTNTISNMDDTIDSRDVIERIEELQNERDSLQSALDDITGDEENAVQLSSDAEKAIAVWAESEECAELAALVSLQDEAEGYAPDWTYGEQLIRETYFEQAMDEMIAECYELPKNLPYWMTISYDYDALKQDYTEVDFDGVTYLVR